MSEYQLNVVQPTHIKSVGLSLGLVHIMGSGHLQELGRETFKLERGFNRDAGYKSAIDRIPEWMAREPVTPTNAVFDVPKN